MKIVHGVALGSQDHQVLVWHLQSGNKVIHDCEVQTSAAQDPGSELQGIRADPGVMSRSCKGDGDSTV